jgi:hypothetical protein
MMKTTQIMNNAFAQRFWLICIILSIMNFSHGELEQYGIHHLNWRWRNSEKRNDHHFVWVCQSTLFFRINLMNHHFQCLSELRRRKPASVLLSFYSVYIIIHLEALSPFVLFGVHMWTSFAVFCLTIHHFPWYNITDRHICSCLLLSHIDFKYWWVKYMQYNTTCLLFLPRRVPQGDTLSSTWSYKWSDRQRW